MQKPQQATISLIHGFVFMVAIIIATVMYFNDLQAFWSVYLLGGICLAGWMLNRAGHSKSSAFILIGSILVVVQYNLYVGYGIHDVAIIAWPTLIFFAGLMIGSEVIPYFILIIMLSGFVARFIPNAQNFIGNTDTSDFVAMLVILSAFSLTAWRLLRGNEISLRQLKLSEERAKVLINSVNDAIFIYDARTCTILDANQKMQKMFGYTYQETLQKNFEAFSSGISPYRREDTMSWLEKASTQGPQIFEWQAKDKKGQLFWVEINMNLAVIGGQTQVVISMRDIADRKKAELDLQRRMVELEALHAVAMAGTEALSTDNLVDRVAGIIYEKLYPDHFYVAFLDGEAINLTYRPSLTQATSMVTEPVPVNRGIIGAVARSGLPRRVGDVKLDPDYLEVNLDTRSELCVPIFIGGRVTGVINLENAKIGSFTETDERLVTAIAGELATAMEKIHLLEEERNRRRELEAIEQISAVLRTDADKDKVVQAVLEQIMAVLNLQGAGFAFLDQQNGDLITEFGLGEWPFDKGIRLRQGDGISHQVAATQHYYLNNDIHSDSRLRLPNPATRIKCLICLSLIVDDHTYGLLYLGRITAFLPADIHLAITIADTFASTMHRIELHEQTHRQVDRLTTLRAIDQSILSSLDLEQILEVLLEKITKHLDVDAANFLLYQPNRKVLFTAADRGLPVDPLKDASLDLENTHAGKVALNRKIDFIPDVTQIKDDLAEEIRRIGADFASYIAVPLVAKGDLKGVLQVFSRVRLEPSPDWMGFLEAIADQSAIAIHNTQLFADQQQTNARLMKAYEDTINGWSRALDMRDRETEGHSQRVTELTLDLAHWMGVADDQLVHIRRGARLHDIGKMGIPDKILLKPGKLNKSEWEIMRQHPIYAVDLLYPIEFLAPALEIPYSHHEKWDGTGYPQGLKGEEIPLAARIFAVVDVWDALTSDRPYRKAWSSVQAMAYIQEQTCKYFDPIVVEHFLCLIREHQLRKESS